LLHIVALVSPLSNNYTNHFPDSSVSHSINSICDTDVNNRWARRNAQRARITSERDITSHTAKLVVLPVYNRFLVIFALAEVYTSVFQFLAAAGYNIATTIALAPLITHGVQEGFAFLWVACIHLPYWLT
jgi:hypothetical protein